MWFKRKSKEQKEQELQAELIHLRVKYAKETDSYCKINNWIFIFKGFKIENNQICVQFVDKDTAEGYINYIELFWFEQKYGHNDFGGSIPVTQLKYLKCHDFLLNVIFILLCLMFLI
jgi:hypothetical protein